MTAAKPLRADARRNRDALIAKARELFADGRFDLRFDDFARLAGVGTGTLYRHFPTREALAEAVYREELTAMCDRAHELQATLPADQALESFLRGFVDHLHRHEGPRPHPRDAHGHSARGRWRRAPRPWVRSSPTCWPPPSRPEPSATTWAPAPS